jgi:hypothetical protein
VIVRSARPASSFTVLANAVIRDASLSWRARGILAYLLSMPDGWTCRSEHLAKVGREGRDAVRAALAELETAGYLVRARRQDERGRWHSVSTIYDRPHTVCGNVGILDAPGPENPTSDSPALNELPNRNDVDSRFSTLLTEHPLTLCGYCDGNGWADYTGTVETCHVCNGARIVKA